MVNRNKKHISSELLHIALVITLLRGNENRYFRQSPVISSNFFNDVSVSNDIMGPSWAYSRTSFHHFYHDPPLHEIKALEGHLGTEDFNTEYSQEDLEIDLNIINQLRSLTLSRFDSLSRLGKEQPTFQDITAYLLSESTSPSNGVPAPTDVVEYETPVVSPNSDDVELTELTEENVVSSGEDSGHEETGDDSDEILASQSVKEFPLDVPNTSITRNSQRRESYGFHSDSDEELIAYEILLQENESPEAATTDITDIKLDTEEIKEETETEHGLVNVNEQIKQENEDASHYETVGSLQEWLDSHPQDVSLQPSSLQLDQTTLELLDHVHLNEIGGAAGIDHTLTDFSDLLALSPDGEFINRGLFLEAERSSLAFYKKFNDISENELNNVVAPQDIHEFEDDDNEPRASSSSSSGVCVSSKTKDEEKDVIKKENEFEETNEEETENIISALLDDILDVDSGVFDFGSDHGDIAHDDLSENSYDSILAGSPPLNEESGPGTEADESNFSADMIQTAPIHASARPTSHAAQPRGFQVHARMPGLLRGGSVEQRWQDLANLLSLQSSSHDPNGAGIHQPIPHHFPPHPYHHHHHHHHTPTPLHHSMHPPHFPTAVPPTTPYSTETARSVLLQNATLPPPELNTTGPYVNVGMGASSNLGSAVASSMHLTNSSEPMIDPSSHYKMMDPSHDMLYYQNSTNEMANQTTTDGFNLSSILNDDELQLMDMAMNEGMYSMRVMDSAVPSANLTTVGAAAAVNHGQAPSTAHSGTSTLHLGATGATSTEDRMEASSDSAVSSMGSERVPPMTDPPMSDNEWVDTESHAHGPHDLSPYSMDYSRGKVAGYEYYKDGSRVPGGPVAQKKHHMFGKRFLQEQSSHPYPLPSHLPYPPQHGGATPQGSTVDLDKYSCGSDFGRYNGQRSVNHGPLDPTLTNHTYSLPPTHPDNPQMKVAKPAQKEKQKMIKYFKTEESLTRDEKKARALSIPITTDDIINLPMDEFNERLSKYDLSEAQLSLIRDIRRRGKNKVAAQNCRKRKLDQILQLADEVQRIRDKKQSLMRDQEAYLSRRTDLKERYNMLYRHVCQALRESDGNPYNSYEFSLHHAADGSVMVVPRNATQPSTSTSNSENGMSHSTNGRRDKPKDDSKKE